MKLTQRTVEALKCPPGKKDVLVFDSELKGLGMRVTSSGGKGFLVQYNSAAGKRRVPLGAFGALTVDQARKAAKALLGDVARGIDPVAVRRAADEAARQAEIEATFTFGKMVDDWAAARGGDRRQSYLREAVLCLKRNLGEWWRRPANAITLREAVAALDAIKDQKGIIAANRTLAYGRAVYSWAVKRQSLAANPLRGIERPGRETARERVLDPDEMASIWQGCDTLGNPMHAAFVRVLMLTLQRREEVGAMQWTEIDNPEDPKVWTIPGERAKNGKPHIVHLSEPVRAILRALPAIKGNPHVFGSGHDGKHVAAYGIIKTEVEKALPDLEDWRFHDFRRAGVTALADVGVPPHVADKLLNHVTGAIQGVAAVYQRAEFLTERRAALDAWAELVMAAVERREPDRDVYQRTLDRAKKNRQPETVGNVAHLAVG